MIDGYFLINKLFLLSVLYVRIYTTRKRARVCVCLYYYAFEISLISLLVIEARSLVCVSSDLALSQTGIFVPIIPTLDEH